MKRILIIAAAVSALAGAAMAQDAYTDSQGAAPSSYPPCAKPGQDRCVQTHGRMAHHVKGRHHMAKAKAKAKSSETSRDGERG